MSDLQHRCAAGGGCRDVTVIDGKRVPRVTEKPYALCDGCIKHVQSCVRQMVTDYSDLHSMLGEKSSNTGEHVSGTPTPSIPLNTQTEALMASILELAGLVHDIVADAMHIEVEDPWTVSHYGRGKAPQLAARAKLEAAIRLVEPNIDKLCATPRFDIRRWNSDGETTTDAHSTGIETALDITNLHRQVRAHIGKTRLRHHYAMPCPSIDKHGNYCGATTVGRDDGQALLDCTTCGVQWTQDMYDFLTELTIEELIGQNFATSQERAQALNMYRWLLAEAYWRLDEIRHQSDILHQDQRMELAGAGPIILTQLDRVLAGHPRPQQRKPAA